MHVPSPGQSVGGGHQVPPALPADGPPPGDGGGRGWGGAWLAAASAGALLLGLSLRSARQRPPSHFNSSARPVGGYVPTSGVSSGYSPIGTFGVPNQTPIARQSTHSTYDLDRQLPYTGDPYGVERPLSEMGSEGIPLGGIYDRIGADGQPDASFDEWRAGGKPLRDRAARPPRRPPKPSDRGRDGKKAASMHELHERFEFYLGSESEADRAWKDLSAADKRWLASHVHLMPGERPGLDGDRSIASAEKIISTVFGDIPVSRDYRGRTFPERSKVFLEALLMTRRLHQRLPRDAHHLGLKAFALPRFKTGRSFKESTRQMDALANEAHKRWKRLPRDDRDIVSRWIHDATVATLTFFGKPIPQAWVDYEQFGGRANRRKLVARNALNDEVMARVFGTRRIASKSPREAERIRYVLYPGSKPQQHSAGWGRVGNAVTLGAVVLLGLTWLSGPARA